MNNNVIATIRHNEYKDVSLYKKGLRYSMNTIQGKDHKIGTYEINKILLFCFGDKIYIQNNGCDALALGNYKKKTVILITIKSFLVKQIVLIFSLFRTAFLSCKLF